MTELKPVAWMHTLHMELDQTDTRLLSWDGVDHDNPQRTAFGVPDEANLMDAPAHAYRLADAMLAQREASNGE